MRDSERRYYARLTPFAPPVGLVYVVVEWQKDTFVNSNNQMTTRSGSPLGVSQVVIPILTSETPDASFNELTTVQFFTGGASFTMPLMGYARLPVSALGANTGGLSLGPIALFTAQGNLLLAGSTLTPMDGAVATFTDEIIAEGSAIGAAGRRHLLSHGSTTMGSCSASSSSSSGAIHSMAYTQGGR